MMFLTIEHLENVSLAFTDDISSLWIKNIFQGLFFPADFIPANKNLLPEMIFPR